MSFHMNPFSMKIFHVLFLLSCVSGLYAQFESTYYDHERSGNEYDLLGKGARAAGMGYAFNAIADDITGIYWNPAGTALIQKPQYGISGKANFLYTYQGECNRHQAPMIYYPDFMGLVYPLEVFGRRLSTGIAYQNQITREIGYYGFGNFGKKDKYFADKSTINSLLISSAYAISPNVFLGASFNYWFSLGSKSSGNHFVKDFDVPYERSSWFNKRTSYQGLNYSLGILFDFTTLNLPVRFSLKYESGFDLTAQYYSKDSVKIIIDATDGYFRKEIWEGTRTYHMPWKLSTGISYRIRDYFTFSCDYDIKPFRGRGYTWDGYYYNDLVTPMADTIFQKDYLLTEGNNNLNQLRMGLEYILHRRNILVPVRVGVKTNNTSVANYDENGQVVSPVRAISFNAGFGIILPGMTLDLAYELYYYSRRTIKQYTDTRIMNYFSVTGITYF